MIPWHSIPATWPTNETEYWVRTWWFLPPFRATWAASIDGSYWLVYHPDTDSWEGVPWFIAPYYRAI